MFVKLRAALYIAILSEGVVAKNKVFGLPENAYIAPNVI